MNRRWWAILTVILFFPLCSVLAQDVRIGVLEIFHPQQITLSPTGGESIVVTAEGKTMFLSSAQNSEIAHVNVAGDHLVLQIGSKVILTKGSHAASSNDGAAGFFIEIPGKIKRQYRGTLDVTVIKREIVPVVTMDLEMAVASVVQAESEPDTPKEALKAQAIVTRSYFVAGRGRHTNFDFCDLTHCQFLREPPKPESGAAMAAFDTRGLILNFEDKPFAAMFTRSCGGETRTLSAIGITAKDYPYFSVRCEACYRNPVRWTRRISTQDASILFAQGEKGRLAVNRRLGWSAVPSNNFTARNVDGAVLLHGTGEGHGLGFCQRGARAMAAEGEDFRKIVLHYFPNTTIGKLAERTTL